MRRLLLPLLLIGCSEPVWYPRVLSDTGSPDPTATAAATGTGTGSTSAPTLPCSEPGTLPAAQLTIRTSLAVRVYWRDPACTELLYHDLGPGSSVEQGTFVGHVWVARFADGTPVDHFVVEDAAAEWVIK